MSNPAEIPIKQHREQTFKSICFKIILIGESSTGKTSLVRSYIHGEFKNDYQVTVGVDFNSKTVMVDKTFVQLQIWDTCGQDVYQSITKSFYRGASAVFLVYSINCRQSFQKAIDWLDKFREEGSPYALFFLIGTKIDLKRQIQPEEALELMKKNKGAFFIQTSALTGQNISTLFQKAAQTLYKCYQVNEQFRKFVNPKNDEKFVLKQRMTLDEQKNVQKKKKCCN